MRINVFVERLGRRGSALLPSRLTGDAMWDPDQSALSLLDLQGPFSGSHYRRAAGQTLGAWRDVSFGARAGDGTQAAMPLFAGSGRADSMPPSGYGEIASSRALAAHEELALLLAARNACGARRLVLRALGSPAEMPHRRLLGNASIVRLEPHTPPAEGYARLARRSLGRARGAGARAVRSNSIEGFMELYRAASANWAMRYPEALLARLVSDDVARVDVVMLDSVPISGLLTLTGRSHWMCWLAAQNSVARELAASYLLYDAVFMEAQAAGVAFINLGASIGGGAEFKRHLGAREEPMYQVEVSSASARAFAAAGTTVRRVLRFHPSFRGRSA
jgi:hypothetical protein